MARTTKTLLPEEGQLAIIKGRTYKEKNGVRQVIPYFVDYNSAQVNFADVGKSNEDKMRTSDFLNRFELMGETAVATKADDASEA